MFQKLCFYYEFPLEGPFCVDLGLFDTIPSLPSDPSLLHEYLDFQPSVPCLSLSAGPYESIAYAECRDYEGNGASCLSVDFTKSYEILGFEEIMGDPPRKPDRSLHASDSPGPLHP